MILKIVRKYITLLLFVFFLVACGSSGMDEDIAKDIKYMAETACEIKKSQPKHPASMEENLKFIKAMAPKMKLMKEAKERVEKYKKSLSGDELKEFKAAGLKIISEINLECLK